MGFDTTILAEAVGFATCKVEDEIPGSKHITCCKRFLQ